MRTMLTKQQLIEDVRNATHVLNPSLIEWFCSHVIDPKSVTLVTDLEKMTKRDIFQITENKNSNSYYIVFDPIANAFGICCVLSSGIEWYLGEYGSIVDALNNI